MKRILVLVFSVLLCVTIAKSLRCRVCGRYKVNKCKSLIGVCEAKVENPRCANIVYNGKLEMWSLCASEKSCNEFHRKAAAKVSKMYCCDTDFCNEEPPWAHTNETSPDSSTTDVTSFAEKL